MGSDEGIGTSIYRLPLILSIPIRLFYGNIVPLPFPSNLITQNYRKIGTLIWYFSIPFLFSSIIESIKPGIFNKRFRQTNYFPIVSSFILLYTIVTTVTMQVRHISMYAPLGAILITFGIANRKKPVFTDFVMMFGIGLILVTFYLIIKLL